MSALDNATERRADNASGPRGRGRNAHRLLGPGVAIGALGILGFSFSLPATRLAVADLDPWLVAFGRADRRGAPRRRVPPGDARAAARPRARPARSRSSPLGVVVGFPLFTSLALEPETPPTARS